MRLVVAYQRLTWVGGVQTYLATLAEHLGELGHEVTAYAPQLDEGWSAELGRRGVAAVDDPARLPAAVDAVLPQDSATAFELAARFPTAPQAQGVHADAYDFQCPPQLPGLTGAAIVCSENVARRVRALARPPEVVRLRQPIDLKRFSPRGPARPRARRVLALGNYLTGERYRMLAEACADLGLELVQVGHRWDGGVPDVSAAIADADIVVGKARALLEGMACGRAAYVYDWNGADGWVTPDRYPELEADNFGGRLGSLRADPARLREDLAAYRPEMGMQNRDLAVAHHGAREHAQAVSALLARLRPRREWPAEPLREMARLVTLQWQAEERSAVAQAEAQLLRAREAERVEALEGERAALGARVAELEAALLEQRILVSRIVASRRHRIGAALAAPIDLLRRRRRR